MVEASSGLETTYRELEHLAVGLDLALRPYDSHVLVIATEKSALFYAAVVRCLILELPFCCIDEDTPPGRISDICGQLKNPLILGSLYDPSLFGNIAVVSPNDISPKEAQLRRGDPDPDAPYYIATSGSTGRPKVIKGRQASLSHFANWAIPFYGVSSNTRWAQFSSTGFDLTLVDIVTVLAAGGVLVALRSRFDRLVPTTAIRRFSVTHWHSVPSAIPHLLAPVKSRYEPQSVVVFTFCGEPLFPQPTASLMKAYPGARVVNTYGPTEGTLFFMAHEVTPQDFQYETIPLGLPIPGWKVLLQPSPTYEELECTICSDLIAFGYVGLEGSQFGRISTDGATTRIFRTGDLLRLKDDKLFFVRRNDRMVKIHGLRVELGEIEAFARTAGAANPVAFKDGKYLHLAYEKSLHNPPQSEIALACGERLPKQLVPSVFSEVDFLPRTLNGKLNHQEIHRQLAKYQNEED